MLRCVSCLAWFALGVHCLAISDHAAAQDTVDFDRDVRPILSNACFTCHGPDSGKRQANLRFDVESSIFADRDGQPILVRGRPQDSELIKRVFSEDADLVMPPPDQKQQLSPREKALLQKWVAQGAEWQGHWAFQPVVRPELATAENREWPENEIDWFVLNRIETNGLSPSAPAAKHTLLRRVSLDLTGLPPTIPELDAFLNNNSATAYEQAVDRLLASPRFGEHFALTWLDAARYADTNGYQSDRVRTMWPWRDWVIQAFNSNLPFDQFTIEQLAGDHLPNPTTDQLVATGFHRNHMLNGEGGRIAEESRVEYVVNRVETTGAVWLGLTLGCGRCHDHKYDPISQREFYSLYAYFNSIDERGNVDAGGNANPVMPVPTQQQLIEKAELNSRISAWQNQLSHLTANHQPSWEKKLLAEISTGGQQEYWITLKPDTLKSEQGQTLELEEDQVTVLVTGKNPKNDNLQVTLKTDARRITALRLEAVPYEKFTNGGFARSDSGNFVLTGFRVDAKSAGGQQAGHAKFQSAQASFEQRGWPVRNAFDGKPNTGWAVYHPPDMRIPRQAMFVFTKPVPGGPDTELQLELRHESPHHFHNLSHFRIAITTRNEPRLDGTPGLSAELIAALKVKQPDRTPAQQKLLTAEFRKRIPEVKSIQQKIDSARNGISEIDKRAVRTMIMRDRAQPRDTFLLNRGVWDQPDKTQPCLPGTPGCLPPLPQDAPRNRLALARWIMAKDNPLTSRVVVNRFWQHFFGAGLVTTPEDFGSQGERPSHPQLLDWLAADFQDGWNIKLLLKRIVMSATYQQSAVMTQQHAALDRANRWLARAPRLRLTSHAIRDQALMLGGLLVETLGGPSVKPYQPPGVWLDNSLGKFRYDRDKGAALYRRSLYTFWRRATPPTMLFDVASRQQCKVRLSRTNTPLHALVLLNETGIVEASRKFAERIIRTRQDAAGRLALAFRMATSRHPTGREAELMAHLLKQLHADFKGRPEQVQKYLATGDSTVDPKLNAAELAAYTAMIHIILNLDETVTKD